MFRTALKRPGVEPPPERPPPKRLPEGLMQCSSCKAWSKDVTWATHCPPGVPDGGACERCVLLYSRAFREHCTWEAFCSPDTEFLSNGKKEAGQYMTDPSKRPDFDQNVSSNMKLSWETTKKYVVCNEKELGKILGVKKVTKTMVDKIPTMTTLTDTGKMEEVFIFAHPDDGLREGILRVSTDVGLNTPNLIPAQTWWTGHALSVWQAKQQATLKQLHFGNVMGKELPLLEDLVNKVKGKKEIDKVSKGLAYAAGEGKSEEDISGGASIPVEVNADDSDEAPLVPSSCQSSSSLAGPPDPLGMLMTSSQKGSTQTPLKPRAPTRPSQSSSLRRPSSKDWDIQSMFSGQSGGSRTSPHPVALDFDAASVRSSTVGGDDVDMDAVREKLPIAYIMVKKTDKDADDKKDGRSVRGLRQLITGLEKNTPSHPALPALRNYSAIADAALVLRDCDFKKEKLPEETLKKYLTLIDIEHAELPTNLKLNLLTRRCGEAAASRDFTSLLIMASPWGESEWSHWDPRLHAVDCSESTKFDFFNSCVFITNFHGMLQLGQQMSSEVLRFSHTCLDWFEKNVKPEKCTIPAATFLAHCRTVFNTFVAILSDKIDPEHADDVTEFKQSMGGTAKTILVNVSSVIQSSDFYMTKLDSYLTDVSSVLQFKPVVESCMESLQGVAASEQCLTTLQGICAQIPDLKANLRDAMVAELLSKLLEQVKTVTNLILEQPTKVLVQQCMELLVETGILYPMDTELPDLREQLASSLNMASQEDQKLKLLEACEEFHKCLCPDLGKEDILKLNGIMVNIRDQSLQVPLTEKSLTMDVIQKLHEAKNNLLKHVLQFLSDPVLQSDLTQEKQELFTSCFHGLGVSVNQVSTELEEILDAMFSMHSCAVARAAFADVKELPDDQCFSEQRSIKKAQGLLNKATSQIVKDAKPAFESICNKNLAALMSIVTPRVQACKDHVDALMTASENYSAKSKEFFLPTKGINLKDLLSLSIKTILQWDPDEVKKAAAGIIEALGRYKTLSVLAGETVDADYLLGIETVTRRLLAVPSVGKFCNTLNKDKTGQKDIVVKYFEAAQKMTKDLKAACGETADEELLPPPLYAKLKCCLAMKHPSATKAT